MSARLEILRSRLQQYIDCEAAILAGAQEYMIGPRQLKRANLNEISEMIRYLEKEVEAEAAKTAGRGRNRVVGIIPRDL
ncbi:DUF6148 family protein [Paenibacillus ehimensis]|uniref:DUF6148 family protein n=1 Tax=Paenibacillus ehimensis TaxID=79264 RepID=UPI0004718227|nr:DUF6148 family protein [Paenibacillus ehimensis]